MTLNDNGVCNAFDLHDGKVFVLRRKTLSGGVFLIVLSNPNLTSSKW